MSSSRKMSGDAGGDNSAAPRKQDTLYVSSLAKGLKILKIFDRNHTELSLTELVKLSGIN